jgi:glycosyltransferase involved in cell wall biosynthesis
MLGRGKGGIEQALLDYSEALRLAGYHVTPILRERAAMQHPVEQAGFSPLLLSARGGWDIASGWKLLKLVKRHSPAAVLCHGNRALQLAALARTLAKLRGLKRFPPLIFVTHNYQLQHLSKADAVFTITRHLAEEAVKRHFPASRVFHQPNAVRLAIDTPARQTFRTPPVMGAMGRHVTKKGFAEWIQALALLKERGIPFRAILAGKGEETTALKTLAAQHGLAESLTFSGWVTDKAAFWQSIDLFCLPSLHEPFGIVLLEAMAEGLPVISTASEGPREIITSGSDGLLIPAGDIPALADAMAQMLHVPETAFSLAQNARQTVAHYRLEAMAERLKTALTSLTTP